MTSTKLPVRPPSLYRFRFSLHIGACSSYSFSKPGLQPFSSLTRTRPGLLQTPPRAKASPAPALHICKAVSHTAPLHTKLPYPSSCLHRFYTANHPVRSLHSSTLAMARKAAAKVAESTESSLSPLPDDMSSAEPIFPKSTINNKKRKAEPAVKVTKRAKTTTVKDESARSAESVTVKKATVKRTKKTQQATASPLEERTPGSKLLVGAHVSIAGGVHNSIANVIHIGANAFAMFMKSQRKWDNPAMDPEHATLFIDGCKSHGIQPGECCLPHGSYLVNLAHPDPSRKEQAYNSFLDDLKRCNRLGIKLYNFHPGNSNATTREEGIRLIANNINDAHKDPETGEVITVLETMASLGNTIGGTFKDLAEIIGLVENKDRVGVCLDTCHVFAAGYDLRTPETYAETMQKFDEVIGLNYLKAFHMNDSKAPFASYRDLHAQIGTGYIGLRAFHNLVNDERTHGLPMVLETPIDRKDANGKNVEDKSVWAREIKLLERLVGMDVESDEFKTLEKDLFDAGSSERERIGDQVERKKAKAAPKKRKSKKKAESEDETDEE
ncbi:AP endonuclease [Corynespora cassiicola Philippines]|uniref:Apurinic-apyrimidinic endonuclease 1 n=1 Tax=Corynespora cassiicola Philippines TaxID=1448308 RepID=A0A2T2NH60_CORCC|nr:AP endonuclease [Corynespora cassiicola Philippines]